MRHYAYQKFLLNCPYEQIDILQFSKYFKSLENIPDLGTEYCLDDLNRKFIRKISLSSLDDSIDTEDDWNYLISRLKGIDILIIYDSAESNCENPIIQEYRKATLQAYLYRLNENQKDTTIIYRSGP